jgi:hypothetical protein
LCSWEIEDSPATCNNGLAATAFFFLVGAGNPVLIPAANELFVFLGILSATSSLRFPLRALPGLVLSGCVRLFTPDDFQIFL